MSDQSKEAFLDSAIFSTPFGWMGAQVSDRGVCRIVLPRASKEEAVELLGNDKAQLSGHSSPLQDLVFRLVRYLEGALVDFPDRIYLDRASPFQRSVLEITRSIPYGVTRSYSWIAARMGRPLAARAVGRALAANPLPIVVPCHRVIGANGALRGYRGGVSLKERLLAMEARRRGG